jgi:hypothetical protein
MSQNMRNEICEDYDGYVLNLRFDHERGMRIIATEEKKLLELLEMDRVETVRSFGELIRDKNAILQSVDRSRGERLQFVSKRLEEEKARFSNVLSTCATNARQNGTELVDGTERRINKIITDLKAQFNSKIDDNVVALKQKYETAILDLREYVLSQRDRLVKETHELEQSIYEARAEKNRTLDALQRLRLESVSEPLLQELELEYRDVKDELLEADRETMTLYNFEKANDEMASKLRVLDSSIHEIKSSSVVSL